MNGRRAEELKTNSKQPLKNLLTYTYVMSIGANLYNFTVHEPSPHNFLPIQFHLIPKMTLWLCKRMITSNVTYAVIEWWDRINTCLARSELELVERTVCIMITGTMRTTPTKVLEMFLDLPPLRTTVEAVTLWQHTAYQVQIRILTRVSKVGRTVSW